MEEMTPFEGIIDFVVAFGVALVLGYLVIEVVLLQFWKRRLDLRVLRMTFLGLVGSAIAGPALTWLLGPLTVGLAAMAGADLSPIGMGRGGLGWVYGFVVYEFFYWLQHWLAHKVRILWCIHSPHHAPRGIHMAIGVNHHFLEGLVYFPFFFGFMTALCGVDPLVAVGVNVLDTVWGSYLHLSNEIVREGRYGWIGRFMQTPAHHRVHHARNPRYMDRNYNSISLLWDWLLGTLEPLRDEEPVVYGITREVDDGSYWDVHFGEFVALFRDLRSADGWAQRLGYVFQPPGWSPGDRTRTASSIRARWVAEEGA